ncbi:hypothetical protein Goklo_024520, partial [Gossypium klotzschianum]|nr:hypothetical protein [Gossypium klotzschianum]
MSIQLICMMKFEELILRLDH